MVKPPKSGTRAPVVRTHGMRPVGALLPEVGGMAFRRFGFAQSALIGRWREVVGPVYARWSVPESIRFPRGEKQDGTLTIRVEGPFSLQLQHVSPQIIERVNRILGHAAIARVKLVHGEVPHSAEPARPAPQPVVEPDTGNLAGVKDDGLRHALENLARQLAATSGPPKIR